MLKGPVPLWCASAFHHLFSQPLVGAARNIQASAPRNSGVTKAATMSARTSPRAGKSVRDTSQANGVPTAVAITATLVATTNEFAIGRRNSGFVKALA